MSQNITVMWRRWAALGTSPGTAPGSCNGIPQPPQKRIPSGLSVRQLAQIILLANPTSTANSHVQDMRKSRARPAEGQDAGASAPGRETLRQASSGGERYGHGQ